MLAEDLWVLRRRLRPWPDSRPGPTRAPMTVTRPSPPGQDSD